MRKLELKLPPVAVFGLTVLLMWLLGQWTPDHGFHPAFRLAAIALCLLAGGFFGLGALAAFRHKQTTVNPMAPDRASSLVTHGVFRFSRNPMYLALLWLLLAVGFALSNFYALALALCFVPYMNRFQIEHEERAMEALFGEDYQRYRARVRRWL